MKNKKESSPKKKRNTNKCEVLIRYETSGINEEYESVEAEKLNDYWCIHKSINPGMERKFCLTHIASGQMAVISTKKAILKAWKTMMDLDIHYSELDTIKRSYEISEFEELCKSIDYRYN